MTKLWKNIGQRINQDPLGRWTLRIFLSLLLLSFILPLLANDNHPYAPIPYGPDTIDYQLEGGGPKKPSIHHFLGTDEQGRDMLARLLYALRFSILFGLFASLISACIGIFIGLVQGYYGGIIDIIFQRIFELWSSVPALFFLMIVSAFFVLNEWILGGAIIFIKARTLIPMVRMLAIRIRELPYIDAARVMGQSSFKICIRHILPNIIVFPLAKFPFMVAKAVSIITTLSFFGFSIPRNCLTFGEILMQGKNHLYAPWILIGGMAFLIGLMLILLLLGEAMQRVFVHSAENGKS
jgi:microcin C transport system permease protein